MRQRGVARKTRPDRFRRQAERQDGGGRRGGVLGVVRSAQRLDAAQGGNVEFLAALHPGDGAAARHDAVGSRPTETRVSGRPAAARRSAIAFDQESSTPQTAVPAEATTRSLMAA